MKAFVLLLLAGCGYTTSQAQALPKGFTKVYVNQAMDNSTDVGAAATVTRVLRERIDSSGVAKLVPLAEAEVVLEARVDGAVDVQGAVATGNTTSATQVPKYFFTLSGSARLIDKNAQIVWQSGGVRADEDYLSGALACSDATTGNAVGCSTSLTENMVPVTEANRRRALDRAAEQLANLLFTRLMEGF